MAAKTCPSCQLVHRASATASECGYDFSEERQTKPAAAHRKGSLPWHEEPLVAVAALAVCWPAGVVLVGQNKHLSKAVKAIIIVSWFGLLLGLLAYRMSAARATVTP
jgi:hypothetical protein